MKKLVVLLSIIVVCLSGCSAKKLDNTDLGKNIKILLTEEVDYSNVYFDGYKFFVPKGLQIISKDEYNSVFLDRNANKYYLYIDAISYYHKVDNDYEESKNSHYSKKIDINDKKEIETTVGIDKFNDCCHDIVSNNNDSWREYVREMCRWVDYDNAYKTCKQ